MNGHTCPALFAAWEENGVVEEKELLKPRKKSCLLEGHPTPVS